MIKEVEMERLKLPQFTSTYSTSKNEMLNILYLEGVFTNNLASTFSTQRRSSSGTIFK